MCLRARFLSHFQLLERLLYRHSVSLTRCLAHASLVSMPVISNLSFLSSCSFFFLKFYGFFFSFFFKPFSLPQPRAFFCAKIAEFPRILLNFFAVFPRISRPQYTGFPGINNCSIYTSTYNITQVKMLSPWKPISLLTVQPVISLWRKSITRSRRWRRDGRGRRGWKNLKERGEKAKTVLDILQKSCFHPEGHLGDFFFS